MVVSAALAEPLRARTKRITKLIITKNFENFFTKLIEDDEKKIDELNISGMWTDSPLYIKTKFIINNLKIRIQAIDKLLYANDLFKEDIENETKDINIIPKKEEDGFQKLVDECIKQYKKHGLKGRGGTAPFASMFHGLSEEDKLKLKKTVNERTGVKIFKVDEQKNDEEQNVELDYDME